MKMQGFRCGALLALLFVGASGSAGALPPIDAKAEARATIYQAEARTVFSGRGWRIARDKPGVLIVEHNIGFTPSYGGHITPDFVDTNVTGVAQVILTFKPESVANTTCSVDAREYSTRKESGLRVLTEDDLKPLSANTPLKGPSPMENEEMLKTIRELLEKARRRLFADHPEYAAK